MDKDQLEKTILPEEERLGEDLISPEVFERMWKKYERQTAAGDMIRFTLNKIGEAAAIIEKTSFAVGILGVLGIGYCVSLTAHFTGPEVIHLHHSHPITPEMVKESMTFLASLSRLSAKTSFVGSLGIATGSLLDFVSEIGLRKLEQSVK